MMRPSNESVTIVEMAPRDGLQNEPGEVATADKIALIDKLSACGFTRIEATSFVSPKWVPQMADAAAVMAGISRRPGCAYSVLTPNMKGFEAALAAKADAVAVFASASEGFSRKNINCSIAESLDRFAPVLGAAKEAGIPVRGYVSCVTDCPYDGRVGPGSVAKVAAALDAMGCHEISLGDTLGQATPETIAAMLEAVCAVVPAERLAGHFHDTAGRALLNIEASLGFGLRVFDAAAGGLGGCPYAPGAKGNVATEAVDAFLTDKGYRTGLDRAALEDAVSFARALRSQDRAAASPAAVAGGGP
ncbi:hydroxymethylglutaryl-CoA lyase [Aurantimonas sp. HBX-1]|uniref:hydroxymethylglutaryl-CoA lyase n=1 Tax=Aurantimonas sp. HBX-1 TaxID=2906072 RepID=UPI001F1D955C|nr:hydroxymethylglutaryl-CoA lyase [Aurantimonas sp. HBX-1]UIJ71095.1 hydroxymethylglutaryl-CoA lyase [Aurantimonas sp. HBX-1]